MSYFAIIFCIIAFIFIVEIRLKEEIKHLEQDIKELKKQIKNGKHLQK